MPSLNLDLDYFDHPKTKRLIGLLGKGADVLPIRLWAYCGRVHAETGTLSGYSAKEIEEIVGWWGKSGESVGAMLKVRFLLKTDDGYAVHEWKEHEGHLWAFKVRGKKAAIDRWAKIAGECMTDASGMLQASNKQCSNQPAKPTDPTNPAGGGAGLTDAEKQAEARSFSSCWITANLPTFLRKGSVEAFTSCILRLGKGEAVRRASLLSGDRKVRDPFAVLAKQLDDERAEELASAARSKNGKPFQDN